ncbi:hypothetical protein ABEB36_015672 [Hypothenemus hampei]|uniref:PHD-type domain-containing protein n=1 Tax=Hypothenemus hampei TaxID=57062 RepID=A0ABD1DZF1_HYPHA
MPTVIKKRGRPSGADKTVIGLKRKKIKKRPAEFVKKSVNDQIFKKFFDFNSFIYLKNQILERKHKEILKCNSCDSNLNRLAIKCDSCLSWFNLDCVGLQTKPKKRLWFCRNCFV